MSRIDAAFTALDDRIPECPELVRKLVEKYAPSRPLAGVKTLLFQHRLGNQYVQTQALIDLGLAPEDNILGRYPLYLASDRPISIDPEARPA